MIEVFLFGEISFPMGVHNKIIHLHAVGHETFTSVAQLFRTI